MTFRVEGGGLCEFGSAMSAWIGCGGSAADFRELRDRRTNKPICLAIFDEFVFGESNPASIAEKFKMEEDKVSDILGLKDEKTKAIIKDLSTGTFSKEWIQLKYKSRLSRVEEIITYMNLRDHWYETYQEREKKWMSSRGRVLV
jgi:hypothetical protein